MRPEMPIPDVRVPPVRPADLGRDSQGGSLLRVSDDGSIERTLIAGRVLYHESLREAVARNVAKDLGDIALPQLPVTGRSLTGSCGNATAHNPLATLRATASRQHP